MKYLILALIALTVAGCQRVNDIEFYEPTKENEAYCIKSKDGSIGLGPVKRVQGKSGSPDFSDNKTFMLKFNILGL